MVFSEIVSGSKILSKYLQLFEKYSRGGQLQLLKYYSKVSATGLSTKMHIYLVFRRFSLRFHQDLPAILKFFKIILRS